MAVAAATATRGVAGQGVVLGAVVDAGTADTIRSATVRLLGEAGDTVAAASTDDGTFTFTVRRPGLYRLHATALGYDPVVSEPFEVATTAEILAELRLGPRPIDLPALHVVRRRSDLAGPLARYYRNLEWHHRTGFGEVLERDDLDALGSVPLRVVLNGQPGLLVQTRPGRRDLITVRSGGRPCAPHLFINGVAAEADDLLAIPISSLEGIEIYRRTMPPGAPAAAVRHDCGLILAWTRQDDGRPMTWGRALIAAGAAVVGLFLLLR